MESSVSNNVLIPSGTTGLPKAAYNDHSRFLDIIDHHCNDFDVDFFWSSQILYGEQHGDLWLWSHHWRQNLHNDAHVSCTLIIILIINLIEVSNRSNEIYPTMPMKIALWLSSPKQISCQQWKDVIPHQVPLLCYVARGGRLHQCWLLCHPQVDDDVDEEWMTKGWWWLW